MKSLLLRRFGWIACVGLCGGAIARAAEPTIPERIVSGAKGERLWEFCQRLSGFDFNGSVLVARDTHIVLLGAFGIADPRNGTPNTTRTLFSTGSVTKQLTATAVLELESKGKLSVQDPISKYLDSVPADKQGITIHHLLTHSSGLPPSLGPDEEEIGRDSLVARALATPLLFEPGSAYDYSNVGYSLAAAIVEHASGKSYGDFMQTLWKRAALVSTGLHSMDVSGYEVARSHNEAMGYPSQTDVPREAWHLVGNGGVLSTPWDLYHWYRWLRSDNGQSKQARKEMFTPWMKEGEMSSHYGYGWVIDSSRLRGGELIWHNGGAMPHGWGCALYHFVDDSLVVVVFTNRTMQGRQPMDFIARGLAQHYFDSTLPLPPVVSDSVTLDSTALSGTWDVQEGLSLELRVERGKLRVIPRGQAAVEALFPFGEPQDLAAYNDRTETLIRLAARGQFDSAGQYMDMPPGESGTGFVSGWWNGLSSLGAFRDVEILGTQPGQAARTHARLSFEQGERAVGFWWEREKCVGIGPSRDFFLEMVPQGPAAFASYDVATGDVTVAEFAGARVLLDRGGSVLKATKRK